MMRNRIALAAMLTAGMTIVSGTVAFSSTSDDGSALTYVDAQTSVNETGSPIPKDCILTDDEGEQFWVDEPPSEIVRLAGRLQELVSNHSSEATGTIYCSKYDGVVVTVASPTSGLIRAIEKLAGEHPKFPVTVVRVPASMDELLAATKDVLADSRVAGLVVGAGPDVFSGGLDVMVHLDRSAQFGQVRQEVQTTLRSHGHSNITIQISPAGDESLDYTRRNDTSPYYMGGELAYIQDSVEYVCSSGIPINYNGVKKLLTAGHCTGSSFSNAGNPVGTQSTTMYPTNAGVYGDWKLLTPAANVSFARMVFSGGVYDSTSLPISGANWGVLTRGSAICSSGRTTGQVCRFYVKEVNRTVGGAAHQTLLRHNSNEPTQPGLSDLNGWDKGDSGGPCHYADGSGGVIVNGIVKGHDSTIREYRYTQLSGVRAWSSLIGLG